MHGNNRRAASGRREGFVVWGETHGGDLHLNWRKSLYSSSAFHFFLFIVYFLVFNQTAGPKDAGSNGQAYTTRFTITDVNGNPGTLAPTGPVGQNPGAVGSIVAGTSSATSAAASATTTAGAANPSATAAGSTSPSTGKSGAATLGVSAMSAVVAVAAGAAAFIGF
jgi:hypothetical protein